MIFSNRSNWIKQTDYNASASLRLCYEVCVYNDPTRYTQNSVNANVIQAARIKLRRVDFTKLQGADCWMCIMSSSVVPKNLQIFENIPEGKISINLRLTWITKIANHFHVDSSNPPTMSIMQCQHYTFVSWTLVKCQNIASAAFVHYTLTQLWVALSPQYILSVSFRAICFCCLHKMVQSDPWNTNGEQITIQSSAIASQQSFEDDFQPSPPPPPSASDRLPDSLEYLQSLGEHQKNVCLLSCIQVRMGNK